MLGESKIPRKHAELFHRHPNNPILTAQDWPYPAHTVFNAGACQMGNETILLVRVEDRRGHSCLALATAQICDVLSYLRSCPAPPLRKRMGVVSLE